MNGLEKIIPSESVNNSQPDAGVGLTMEWCEVYGQAVLVCNIELMDINYPYSILTYIEIRPNQVAQEILIEKSQQHGNIFSNYYLLGLLNARVSEYSTGMVMRPLIDACQSLIVISIPGNDSGEKYEAKISVRRMGDAPKKSFMFNIAQLIESVFSHVSFEFKKLSEEKAARPNVGLNKFSPRTLEIEELLSAKLPNGLWSSVSTK